MSEPLQHSPGPWTYLTGEEGIVDAENKFIVDLGHSHYHGDGYLCAAAPDMLRLLRVFAIPINSRRLASGELRAALKETDELLARLDGGE